MDLDPIVKIRIENAKISSIRTLDRYKEFLREETVWVKTEEARRKKLRAVRSSKK